MKGFIRLTKDNDEKRIYISIDKIIAIDADQHGVTRILVGPSMSQHVLESVEDVVNLIMNNW